MDEEEAQRTLSLIDELEEEEQRMTEKQIKSSGPIPLSRDCEALQVPSGRKVLLPVGTQVMITQSLGGSYTVMTEHGDMVCIAGKDSDAIGKGAEAAPRSAVSTAEKGLVDIEKWVWEQMKTCYDPEIPVNIVDLGLVYHCQVTPLPKGGNKVEVKFTLTTPSCGMGDWLKEDIERKILSLPGVEEVDIEVVFEPPWDQSMMSGAAKRELGII